MTDIVGTPNNDILDGTVGDDTITAGGSYDLVHAGPGNDTVYGDDGDDTLYGGSGNDIVHGGTGNDYLIDTYDTNPFYSGGGNDSLYGEDGNDFFQIYHTNDLAPSTLLLDGGSGDDTFSYTGANRFPYGIQFANIGDIITVSGGSGADQLFFTAVQSAVIDMGADQDYVKLDIATVSASITLGTATDFFEPSWYNHSVAPGTITITDFAAGVGGDRLVFDWLVLAHSYQWNGSNPFGNGSLRLVQSGADALVQFFDPGGGYADFVTIFRLANQSIASLTEFNLGFNPTGGSTSAQTIDGTAGADRIRGFGGADTISGLDGDDWINGLAGDDVLIGGAGRDILQGDYGNDTIYGGIGDDQLQDQAGSDSLFGEAGNDYLGYETIFGPPAATILLDGGDGNDFIRYSANQREVDTVTLVGGSGNDTILSGIALSTTIAAGDGDDQVYAELLGGPVQVALGAGADVLRFTFSPTPVHGLQASVTVSDFVAGPDGDYLVLSDLLFGGGSTWNGAADPFAAGYLRIVQQGANAVVQRDANGGGDGFQTVLVLSGVTAANLSFERILLTGNTQYTFGTSAADDIYNFNYNGRLYAGAGNDVIHGSGGPDWLYGESGDDTIDGGADADMLFGGSGNDTITGSFGFDKIYGGDGDDTVIAGFDDLLLDGGAGTDKVVFGGSGLFAGQMSGMEALELTAGASLTLTGAQFNTGLAINSAITGTGNLIVNMTAGEYFFATQMTVAAGVSLTVNGTNDNDVIKGPLSSAITINGGDGTDQIRGSDQNDTINGGDGNDKIMGLGGADLLTGGAGADQFRYLFASDSGLGAGADTILDFVNGQDKLDFRALDADPAALGRQLLSFIGTSAFANNGTAQLRYADSGGDTLVQVDLDGNGIADMQIVLAGHAGQALAGTDFMF